MTEGNSATLQPETARPEQERVFSQSWLERNGVADTQIGQQIHDSFQEVEAQELAMLAAEELRPEVFAEPRDVEVYRELLREVQKNLRASDSVLACRMKVKEHGYAALTELDRRSLIQAFDRAREHAFRTVEMSGRQARHIRFAVVSELNYGLREAIIHGTPEEWMVLDPRARRVDFMESGQIRKYLRNTGTPSQDVSFLREEAERPGSRSAIREVAQELET
jgi:hypothetical protein